MTTDLVTNTYEVKDACNPETHPLTSRGKCLYSGNLGLNTLMNRDCLQNDFGVFFYIFFLPTSFCSLLPYISVKMGTIGRITFSRRTYHIPYGSLLRIWTRIRYIWFDTLSARARTRLSRHFVSLSDLNDGPPAQVTGPHLSISPFSWRRLFSACRNRYWLLIIILMGPYLESWK